MELFHPQCTIVPQFDNTYDLRSVTLTPNTCFSAGPAREGLPPGYVVTPETLPVILELRNREAACADVITPVRHWLSGLKLGNELGKTRVTAFVTLCGAVLGTCSVSINDIAPCDGDDNADGESAEAICHPTSDWYAWDNRQPPGPRGLYVIGTVTTPTPCFEITLEEAVIVPPPPPEQLPLMLTVKPIPGPCIQVVTQTPVRYEYMPYEGQYDVVSIHQDGCMPLLLPIKEVW